MQFKAIFSSICDYIGDSATNDLLVKDKDDLKHFQKTTHGQIVIMGRKTIDSLPKRLKDRLVICLTHDKNYRSDKADMYAHDVESVVRICKHLGMQGLYDTAYVAGGAKVLDAFAPYLGEIVETRFDERKVDCLFTTKLVTLPDSVLSLMRWWSSDVIRSEDIFKITSYKPSVRQ